MKGCTTLCLGLDIGSTTAKVVVRDGETVLFERYERHFSMVRQKAAELLEQARAVVGDAPVFLAISGSAGLGLSEAVKVPFVQEVYATSEVVRRLEPDTSCVIELGGEDAKIIFFDGGVDERMNGSCAGGTGAFIDQMATLLNVTADELDELSLHHTRIYPIASRCGVFAKTDIQPLLNQGARKEDVAASIYQAVVNQTVAGLAQGRKISGKVLFLGGPLYYCKGLRQRFAETLGLSPENAVYAEYARFSVALGASLYAEKTGKTEELSSVIDRIRACRADLSSSTRLPALFASPEELAEFRARHEKNSVPTADLAEYSGKVWIGIDCGSTTTKLVVIGEDNTLLYTYYASNRGNPVQIVREQLTEIYRLCGDRVTVCGSAVTGYGEDLIRNGFGVDYGIVETIAHYTAAKYFRPNVDFILDIGGQDIKCFRIRNGAIDSILLNEACSSGCGSFLETFARAMGYTISEFAEKGLAAKAPVNLGSRCTVFMNSSVKQSQKDGASVEDISAGLAVSVVKNAIYKVIRAASASELGENIVVQGGTFHNDGVLRAFERELGHEVIRPSIAGLMGAFGAALYAKRAKQSTLLSAEALDHFVHTSKSAVCKGCTNHCHLTVNDFGNGTRFVSGNQCEKGAGLKSEGSLPNLHEFKRNYLTSLPTGENRRGRIGLPMALGMFELLPLWNGIFTALGFETVSSPLSTRQTYEKAGDNHYNCPVVAYYSELLNGNVEELKQTKFLYPYLNINSRRELTKELQKYLSQFFGSIPRGEVRRAVNAGFAAYDAYMAAVRAEGEKSLAFARKEGKRIMVLSGRPYHIDPEIGHGIDKLATSLGFVVVSEDSVCHLSEPQRVRVLNQWTYHARLYRAARYAAEHEDTQLVQLVSFGCGVDAITTDEVREILEGAGKYYTQLKIDEITNLGAVRIRLRSLLGALDAREESK